MKQSETIVKSYKGFAVLSGSLLIISSIIYSVMQLIMNKTISDTLFISLTLGESLFILFAGYRILLFIVQNRVKLSSYAMSSSDPKLGLRVYLKLVNMFILSISIVFVIIIWAGIMGVMPLLQNYWIDNNILTLLYGLFLFFTNVITAYFLILLLRFFRLSGKLWNLVHVELWKRKTPSAQFIFSLTKQITLVAAIYMTSSLTAWVTSPKVPFGGEILIFILFSILLLIGSITIPSFPYIRNISNLKRDALIEIDSKIQDEYQYILGLLQAKNIDVSFNKMNALIEMRNKIESISIFPFRIETIAASISIILISLLPVFLEYTIKLLFEISL
jgi:hypothetical protein